MEKAEEMFKEWKEMHFHPMGECTDKDAAHCAFMCGIAFAMTYLRNGNSEGGGHHDDWTLEI